MAATLREWAELDIVLHEWPDAGEKLRRSLAMKGARVDGNALAQALTRLALVEREQGRDANAEALRRLAVALRSTAGRDPGFLREVFDTWRPDAMTQ
jgi:hypothetical protein